MPHKKVFASSIKRTSRWQPALQSRKSFVRTGIRPFAGCGAGDASGRIFGASWRRLPVIMPYRAYSGLVQPTDTASGQLRGEQRLHGRRGAAGHFGVVLRREMNAVLTQDGKLPCIEIAAAEAPGNAGVNGASSFDFSTLDRENSMPSLQRSGAGDTSTTFGAGEKGYAVRRRSRSSSMP